jgi:hypothetical protein
MVKRCKRCGLEFDHTGFYVDRTANDGRRAICKGCDRAANFAWYEANRQRAIDAAREWQRRNPERYRETQERYNARRKSEYRADHLRRNFGFTLEEYDAILAAQDGRCGICGDEPAPGQFLHVDHDHESGDVRGLLCVRCNNGCGQFRENPQLLMKALDYVECGGFAPNGVYADIDLAITRAKELVKASG